MKAVIFAGGQGTRLWPLSRKKSPKQFEKLVGDKSTLQLSVERLMPEFDSSDIFISTGASYINLVKEQLPFIKDENIIAEPLKRDVGPAVGMVMGYMAKHFKDEPVIILWSDHLVKNTELFKRIIKESGKLIEDDPNKIVFIGQKPRFASDNLGWIKLGNKVNVELKGNYYSFAGFSYRPNSEMANTYFESNSYCWNLGYFVTSPKFMYSLFKKYTPEIYKITQEILLSSSKEEFDKKLNSKYQLMPEISFDNAVLERISAESAIVSVEDLGWSDVGAWEALKEALEQHKTDNITKGQVLLDNSQDNLVYNYENGKLVVGVNLNELLVINTTDVLLVASKDAVSRIKKIVESFPGTVHDKLT